MSEHPEPGTQEAEDAGCTCRAPAVVGGWAEEPPDVVIDPYCPLHGWRDVDRIVKERKGG